MAENRIISFTGNEALHDRLKQWAAADDRSVSSVIRQIIEAETERRESETRKEAKPA